MQTLEYQRLPFEFLLTRENNKKSGIVCQRYFMIKKADLSQLDSPRVADAMKRCSAMIENALVDASFLFQKENGYVITIPSLPTMLNHSRGDILYVTSEDKFYQWSENNCKLIENDGEYRAFLPVSNFDYLILSLYYNVPAGARTLICQARIDISIYPRAVTKKVDITGKRKYWEGAKTLIPNIIKEFWNQINSKAVKKLVE